MVTKLYNVAVRHERELRRQGHGEDKPEQRCEHEDGRDPAAFTWAILEMESRLDATVKAYNAAVAAGCTSTLTPLRSAERIKPLPIAAPPFRAIEVCAGITSSGG